MKAIYSLFVILFVQSTISNAANFSSVSSGTWSAPATWSITSGTDADGIPDQDDDVVINGGHTISLTSGTNVRNFTNNGFVNGNIQTLSVYGNITNTGGFLTKVTLSVRGNCTLTSSNVFNGANSLFVIGNLTVTATTTINVSNSISVSNTRSVTNFGQFSANSTLGLTGSASWVNSSGSRLSVGGNITGTGALLASATNNTVTYFSNSNNSIKSATYYDLVMSPATPTRTANGVINILNDFTLQNGTNNTLNMAGFNLTVGGNWNNFANRTILNQGIVTFNGSGSATISRNTSNEVFSNLVINKTGTVNLARSISCGSLTVSSGTLDVSASNFSVSLTGNLVNNGSINCRNGIFNFIGSSLQSVSGSSVTRFYDLGLNNTAGMIINSAQQCTNALFITNGNFNSNGNFTLRSTASATARIASVGAGGSFSNNMIIEKFISARSTFSTTAEKAYHDLCSPVQSTTIMDWDDEIYMSGIGPYDGIVGPAGVDGTSPGFPSSYSYNEPTASYSVITGSNYPIVSGRAYHIWLADNLSTWNAKAINTIGVPTFGVRTVTLSYTPNAGGYGGLYDGLNLIGNPYASAVNYSATVKTNVVSGIQMLNGSGNYAAYSDNTLIPSCQGFYVQATGPGASVQFTENSKSTSTASLFYRTLPDYAIKLLFSSPHNHYYNENTIKFHSSSTPQFDIGLDAVYIKSPIQDAAAMYMTIGQNGGLILNCINPEEDEVIIPLTLYTPDNGLYYIEPSIVDLNQYSRVWIENIKTGKKYDLTTDNVAIQGVENQDNQDYVLRLSKKASSSANSAIGSFYNDLIVFNVENKLNIKANSFNHDFNVISIIDLSGKLIMEYSNIAVEAGNVIELDLSSLSSGMYIVNIINSNNQSFTRKVIK